MIASISKIPSNEPMNKFSLAIALSATLAPVFSFGFCLDRLVAQRIHFESSNTTTEESYFLIPSKKGSPAVHLVNNQGFAVNSWKLDKPTVFARLTSNGDLWVPHPECGDHPAVCIYKKFVKYNWHGQKIDELSHPYAHHDFLPLNKKFVLIANKKIKYQNKHEIWDEEIVEFDEKKNIVWKWSFAKNLPFNENYTERMNRRSICHANGLHFTEKNPIDGEPAYLLTCRHRSQVLMINRTNRKVIWSSRDRFFKFPHDSQFLENGNVLVFSNMQGDEAPNKPWNFFASQVVEISPKDNSLINTLSGHKTSSIQRLQFYSPIVSGAQRLSNGNTVITDGVRGHVFEVSPQAEVVRSLIVLKDNAEAKQATWPGDFIFKVRKYKQEDFNQSLSLKNRLFAKACSIFI